MQDVFLDFTKKYFDEYIKPVTFALPFKTGQCNNWKIFESLESSNTQMIDLVSIRGKVRRNYYFWIEQSISTFFTMESLILAQDER